MTTMQLTSGTLILPSSAIIPFTNGILTFSPTEEKAQMYRYKLDPTLPSSLKTESYASTGRKYPTEYKRPDLNEAGWQLHIRVGEKIHGGCGKGTIFEDDNVSIQDGALALYVYDVDPKLLCRRMIDLVDLCHFLGSKKRGAILEKAGEAVAEAIQHYEKDCYYGRKIVCFGNAPSNEHADYCIHVDNDIISADLLSKDIDIRSIKCDYVARMYANGGLQRWRDAAQALVEYLSQHMVGCKIGHLYDLQDKFEALVSHVCVFGQEPPITKHPSKNKKLTPIMRVALASSKGHTTKVRVRMYHPQSILNIKDVGFYDDSIHIYCVGDTLDAILKDFNRRVYARWNIVKTYLRCPGDLDHIKTCMRDVFNAFGGDEIEIARLMCDRIKDNDPRLNNR